MFITLISLMLVALIAIFIYRTKVTAKNVNSEVTDDSTENTVNNILGKGKLKLMSYKEALEASKQFIFDIARSVMEKFTPDSRDQVIEIGKTMVKLQMKYFHVVDIFALSVKKQKSLQSLKQKPQIQQGR